MEFPHIDPVAFWLGPVPVRWYALAYLGGFLLGWRYCLYLARRLYGDGNTEGGAKHKPITPDVIDDLLPWVILGVILGGRAGYVLFYQWGYFQSDPMEILKIWHGGMSFHGGLAGVALVLVIYTQVRKISLLRLSDLMACAAPLGLFFGRIANFVNGELFGRPTTVSWGIVFPNGGSAPRHPSQLYEAALEGLLLFVILFSLARFGKGLEKPGFMAATFLIFYGLFRSFVELFREPDAHIGLMLGFISMGQVLSLPMVFAGLCLAAYSLRTRSSAKGMASS